MGRFRKPLSSLLLRGFESLSLRQKNKWFLWIACWFDIFGDVAQLGEHLVRNEGVGGSNPLISTKNFKAALDGEVAVP